MLILTDGSFVCSIKNTNFLPYMSGQLSIVISHFTIYKVDRCYGVEKELSDLYIQRVPNFSNLSFKFSIVVSWVEFRIKHTHVHAVSFQMAQILIFFLNRCHSICFGVILSMCLHQPCNLNFILELKKSVKPPFFHINHLEDILHDITPYNKKWVIHELKSVYFSYSILQN